MRSLFCCGGIAGSQLLEAARLGDAAAAARLIAANPSVARRAQKWGGQTAWHIAARDGHADVLRSMAAAVRSLNQQQLKLLSRFGDTAEDIIRHLAGAGDTKSLTPLHLACIKGHAEEAAVLMTFGVNPFAMDSVGRTALHYAASWGHADCLNAVLCAHSGLPKPGWDVSWPNDEETRLVDVKNLSCFTPLHYAVWVGRKEAIQALASYDASVRAVNTTNDFDWIKVGAGNTPLHLAAFGGDFDVVRLLLAAHVQTLSAGAEVMAAGRGQWGERHADDVRHIRNRRGLMAYHIAVHKNFQHLTELLHPDIPYTFIFSNDDMDVGSVRMFGPPRLMVIAAKALQKKLVDELATIEAAPQPTAVAATEQTQTAAALSAADSPGLNVSNGAASSQTADEQQQLEEMNDAGIDRVASPVGELLSPFAARSHKKWTISSLSERSGSTASLDTVGNAAAAAAAPAAAGPASSFISDSATDITSIAAGTDAAVSMTAAQIAAAASTHLYGDLDIAAVPVAGGSAADDHHSGSQEFTFSNLLTQQQQGLPLSQQQQQRISLCSNASDGSMSSTVPGSVSAVAGTPAGSVVSSAALSIASSQRPVSSNSKGLGPAAQNRLRSSSSSRFTHESQELHIPVAHAAANGLPLATAAAVAAHKSSAPGSVAATGGKLAGSSLNGSAAAVRHRRAYSTATATAAAVSDGSTKRLSLQADGAGRPHGRRSTADWLRPMDSLRRAASRRSTGLGDDVLPPSLIITSTADDDDHDEDIRSGSSNHTRAGSVTAAHGPPTAQDITRLRHELQQQQQQQQQHSTEVRSTTSGDVEAPCEDNPVDVILAHRADIMGEDVDAIRQSLVLLKLASGAINFNSAVTAACVSPVHVSDSPEAAGSFTAQQRRGAAHSGRSSVGSRSAAITGSRDQGYGSEQPQQQGSSGDVAAVVFGRSSMEAQISKLSAEEAAAAARGSMMRSSSISRSTLVQQPSLQRLLSGPSRRRVSVTVQQSGEIAAAAAAAAATLERAGDADLATAGHNMQQQQIDRSASLRSTGSVALVAAANAPSTGSSNGGLPIIQQQHKVNMSGGCSGIQEESDCSSIGNEENVCEICFDAQAVVALRSCGHTLCVACCKEMCKLHHFKPALCPYCRQIICGLERADGVSVL